MYERVIPRDLFNESSLLKCYGRLYIILEGNARAQYPVESVSDWDIVQRQDDGSLFIANLPLVVGENEYRLTRPLNARSAWPLYAELIGDPDAEEIQVFTDQGDLTPEMLAVVS